MFQLNFIHGLMFGIKVDDTFVITEDSSDPPEQRVLFLINFLFLELAIVY